MKRPDPVGQAQKQNATRTTAHNRALTRLKKKYPKDFNRFYAEELEKLESGTAPQARRTLKGVAREDARRVAEMMRREGRSYADIGHVLNLADGSVRYLLGVTKQQRLKEEE